MVPDTETSIGLIFCIAFRKKILRRDRDESIKCKAYFAEVGQAYFAEFGQSFITINEISNKQVCI